MDDKKTPFIDALVKVLAWTHNTSLNKLGYSSLQLVTGKAVTIPGLTMGNEWQRVSQILKQYSIL